MCAPAQSSVALLPLAKAARRLKTCKLPLANAWLVTLLEIFGGLALLIGAFVTIVSVPLILSMLGAMFTVNIKYGFSAENTIGLTPEGPQLGPPGYEINLPYIACLVLLIPRRCRSFVDRCAAKSPQKDGHRSRLMGDMPFPENSTVVVADGAWADESSWKEVILPVNKQELQVFMFRRLRKQGE
jgi:uncharacterized membrane protein YphA (DoxX/SURF4 family)